MMTTATEEFTGGDGYEYGLNQMLYHGFFSTQGV